jgi:hypothetical protein
MSSWRKKKPAPSRGRSTPRPEKPHAETPRPEAASTEKPAGKQSWKSSRKRKREPDRSERDWHKSATDKPIRSSRPFKLFLGFGSLAVLCAVFLFILMRRPVQTPLIVLAASVYDDAHTNFPELTLPRNLWAAEDLESLKTARSDNLNILRPHEDRRLNQDRFIETLTDTLRAAKPGGPRKDTLLVYLSFHTTVDSDGNPCLLTSDANIFEESKWLRFEKLLREIEQVQPGARKVILLDCGRIGIHPGLGLLNDRFVTQAAELLRKEKPDNVWVMFSHSPGERTWTLPELGSTPFAFYISEGMKGAADANGDQRITLRELYDYVRFHTNELVQDRFDGSQHPLLAGDGFWPSAPRRRDAPETNESDETATDPPPAVAASTRGDFPIAHSTGGPEPVQPQISEQFTQRLENRLQRLQGLDQQLERKLTEIRRNRERFSPVQFANLLAARSDLEDWLPAGTASVTNGEWSERLTDCENALRALAEPVSSEAFHVASVADVRRTAQHDPSVIERVAEQIESPVELTEETALGRPDDVAVGVWEWLVRRAQQRSTVSKADVERGLRLLRQVSAPPLMEVQFLAMLEEWIDWDAPHAELGEAVAWAIRCRDAVERAGQFEDPRVFDWLRNDLEQLAETRRQAEDRMYVGTPKELSQAISELKQSLEEAERLLAAGRSLHEAYHFRDLSVHWLLSCPGSVWDLLDPEFSHWNQEIHELEQLLEQRGGSAQAVEASLAQARGTWEGIRRRISTGVASLTSVRGTQPIDAPSRRRLQQFNRLPLIAPGDEDALRRRLAESDRQQISVHLTGRRGSEQAERIHPHADPLKISNAFARQLAWIDSTNSLEGETEQALLIPASGDLREADLRERLNRQGRRYRELLAAAPRRFQTLTELSSQGDRNLAGVERQLAEADRLVRIVAPQRGFSVLRRSGADAALPAQRLAGLMNSRIALWRAEQTIRDFWGPQLVGTSQTPFFETIASRQSNAALRGISRTDQPWLQPEQERVSRLLKEHQAAMEAIARASGEDIRIWVDPDRPDAQRSGETLQHRISAAQESHSSLPSGTALLAVRSRSDRSAVLPLDDAGRRAALPAGPSGFARQWFVTAPEERFVSWGGGELTTWFRGHSRSSSFRVLRSVERSRDIQFAAPQTIPAPQVTVQGDANVRPVIMLLLDSSGSMHERDVPAEGGRSIPRMQAARRALQQIVQRLPDGAFHVGFIAFGHRYRFRATGSKEVVDSEFVNSQFGRVNDPAPIRDPDRDIQVLIRPQLTSDQLALNVQEIVTQLTNWGQTPLYASILRALREMEDTRFADQPKHIIVISDGMNETTGYLSPQTDVIRSDLEPLLKQDPTVKIDVIGIGKEFQEDREKEVPEYKNLLKLLALCDGEVHFAADVSSLLDRLERSLELVHFNVAQHPAPADGRNQQRYQLGSTWRHPDSEPLPARYDVTLHGLRDTQTRTVEVRGGEHLRLYLDTLLRDGTRERVLRHHRYGPGEDEIRDQVVVRRTGGEATLVAAHQSRRQGTEVTHRLSFQNENADRFSPRPAHVLVEITPLEQGDSVRKHESYLFYDFAFEVNRPVPVVPFTVPRWPASARESSVNVTFATEEITPDFQSRLDACENPLRISQLPETVFNLEYGTDERDRFRLVVTEERHSRGKLDPDPADFRALVTTHPPPARVTRRYFETSNKIQHIFEFNAGSTANPELRILTKAKLMQFAHETERPLTLVVPRP